MTGFPAEPAVPHPRRPLDLSVTLVTDSGIARAVGHELPDLVARAVRGGVTCVQVREKNAGGAEFLATVLAVAEALPASVTLLVNDRVDVYLAARAAGARVHGVHVGQSDLPVGAVRAIVGTDAVIGLSAATPAQLAAAAADDGRVDYVGIGALHATSTKRDAPAALGGERFAALVAASTLPAVGIGGVAAGDLPGMRAAGAAGAAVVSAICGAADPEAAARELAAAWRAAQ